ncbi:DEKNAAC101792 [Brettanomyces naardenensis]|uniref:DEKNAAC101792 n=1 Tax=Brettanomyces naardenensis TaxID=13370 RepID=A0A448YJ61_BRENA|nr:DEKNAAC101792 [Brettanomyces naardenensis]
MSQYEHTTVSVAPLVLLSVVDHYERILKTSTTSTNSANKRVVGVILGDSSDKSLIKITNSFAIPFEEDEKNPNIWFLDHNFIDSMMEMFKKINAKEKLIGWYHSGPKLRQNDLKINEILKSFTPNPLLLIVDVNSTDKIDIPTDCYVAIEEIKEDGSSSEKTFLHLPSIIQAEEAEEIGVEHLLRDIRDQACGNLALNLTNNFRSLTSLSERLTNVVSYINRVIAGELPINNVILGKLQDIFNLFPNISGLSEGTLGSMRKKKEAIAAAGTEGVSQQILKEIDSEARATTETIESESKQLSNAFNVKTNDELMLLYVSSLVRSIIAFHDLIDNKIENQRFNEKETTEGGKNEQEAKDEAGSESKKGEGEGEEEVEGEEGEEGDNKRTTTSESTKKEDNK